MKVFKGCYQNELFKIFSRKKYFVFMIIEALVCLLSVLMNLAVQKASGMDGAANIMLGNMPMNMLSFALQLFIPLIVFMAVCDLFTSEIHDGTIRASYMRPVSRFKLFTAKVAATGTMAMVYLAIIFVVTVSIKMIAGGGGAGSMGVFETLLAYLLDIFPLMIVVLFAVFLNQFLNSPSLSIVLCVIIYAGLYIMGLFEPQFSTLLFTGYSQWHNLWLGVMLPVGALIKKTTLLLGYAVIFASVGYYLFERKEI